MKQLAHIVARQMVKNQIISEEEAEIYDYGLQLVLTSGTTTFVILLLGLVSGQLTLTVLFMITLVGLRHYVGGYHAGTYLHCFLMSCSVYLGMILFVHTAPLFFDYRWIIITNLSICVYICRKGSVNSQKQEKTKEQMQQRARITRILTCLFTAGIIGIYCKGDAFYDIASLLWYVEAITALGIGVEQRKRKK